MGMHEANGLTTTGEPDPPITCDARGAAEGTHETNGSTAMDGALGEWQATRGAPGLSIAGDAGGTASETPGTPVTCDARGESGDFPDAAPVATSVSRDAVATGKKKHSQRFTKQKATRRG